MRWSRDAGARRRISRSFGGAHTDAVKYGSKTLKECQVKDENVFVVDVPGSYELPFACSKVIGTGAPSRLMWARQTPCSLILGTAGKYDVVIAIGCLIKGQTMHFEYIAEATAHGLMEVQLKTGIPVIFGVLTCLTDDQALARAGLTTSGHNHGIDWAITAVEMANLSKKLQ